MDWPRGPSPPVHGGPRQGGGAPWPRQPRSLGQQFEAWRGDARGEGEHDAHLGHGRERPTAWLSGGGDAIAARSDAQRGRESARRALACSS
jgi:hypothetical protein